MEKRLGLRLTSGDYKELEKLAKKDDRSMSSYVRILILEKIEKERASETKNKDDK
jgi:hypothetical protein